MADNPEKKAERISTITAAVKAVIDAYAIGHEFYGNELKDDCVELVPQYKDAYVDTFLKMMRRHRRDSCIAINHNNSLYKRVKSNFEIEQEKIEFERAEEVKRKELEKHSVEQIDLPLFSQGLFAFFFTVILGLFFLSDFVFGFDVGAPLLESFIAAKSLPVYIPAVPVYLKGVIPLRCSRLFTASADILPPSAFTMSTTVISIPSLYRYIWVNNQVANVQMFRKWNILLHVSIAKNHNISENIENSFQNLDGTYCLLYTVLMFRLRNIINGIGETERRNGSTVAKGDFYERLSEFSGMA